VHLQACIALDADAVPLLTLILLLLLLLLLSLLLCALTGSPGS
jgi:hypothetical protein